MVSHNQIADYRHFNCVLSNTRVRLRDGSSYDIACDILHVPIRVVLDTDVLVAAIRSDSGASRALLIDALEGQCQMLASIRLMIEYEAILTRPEHLDVSGLSNADVQVLLDAGRLSRNRSGFRICGVRPCPTRRTIWFSKQR